jgi:hypothetical protein
MTTATRERPILFSGPMVRAILEGRKTQTRRVIDLREFKRSDTPGYDFTFRDREARWQDYRAADFISKKCPYGVVGETLWVRETFAQCYEGGALQGGRPVYRADGGANAEKIEATSRWSPAIHMPRWASRISLHVIDVRVQLLKAISEQDAIAEGIRTGDIPPDEYGPRRIGYILGDDDGKCVLYPTPQRAFEVGWDSINGKRAPWASNPFVWVISFERIGATP